MVGECINARINIAYKFIIFIYERATLARSLPRMSEAGGGGGDSPPHTLNRWGLSPPLDATVESK